MLENIPKYKKTALWLALYKPIPKTRSIKDLFKVEKNLSRNSPETFVFFKTRAKPPSKESKNKAK